MTSKWLKLYLFSLPEFVWANVGWRPVSSRPTRSSSSAIDLSTSRNTGCSDTEKRIWSPTVKKISCFCLEDFCRFFPNNILHQPFICSKRTGPSHKPSCCLDNTYCYRELSTLPWNFKNCHQWRRLPLASLSPELCWMICATIIICGAL